MSDSFAVPDSDEAVLAQFLHELAEKGEAAVGEYSARHPHLAEELKRLAALELLVEASRPDDDSPTPQRLGDFHIVRAMDGGGMGKIYEAIQEPLGRRVVVKTIRRGRIAPQVRARFLREQTVLARLHQTHIVPIHAAGEEGSLQYFAMPYIEGAALHHVVRAVRRLDRSHSGSRTPTLAEIAGGLSEGRAPKPTPGPEPSTTEYPVQGGEDGPSHVALSAEYHRSVARALADAADALHHAHEAGFLHRDVKPSNVMVDRAGHCWLIDFGLAGFLNGAGAGDGPVAESGPLGTPQYMAPEQFTGRADVPSDVWGLGATLYELLTLRRCFDGVTLAEVRAKIEGAAPPSPRSLMPGLPSDLAAICLKALHKDPSGRYQTAKEFADDLRRWLGLEPTAARPAQAPRRAWLWARRNPGWAAATTFLILASGLVITILHQRAETAAAEARAEDRRRESERESLRNQLLYVLITAHKDGWQAEAQDLVRRIPRTGPTGDADLRNLAAATFVGLDARPVKTFKFDTLSLAFDPAGKRLFMSEQGKGVRIWDGSIEEPKLLHKPDAGGMFVFRPDGTALQLTIPMDDRSVLVLWDVVGQKQVQRFQFPGKDKWTAHSFSATPDVSLIAGAATAADGKGGVVAIWEGASGQLVHSAPTAATAVALTPDRSLLAVGDRDGRIIVRSIPKGSVIATLRAGTTAIQALTFGRDPRRPLGPQPATGGWLLAAGDAGSRITVWDVANGIPRSYCLGSTNGVNKIAFSPDGTTLASGGRGNLKFWDIATGRLLLDADGIDLLSDLNFSSDGGRVAIAGVSGFHRGGVRVSELKDGPALRTLRGQVGAITKLCFSPDGRLLAGLADDWHVAVWERPSGRLRFVFDVPIGYFSDNAALAFNANGSRLAFCSGTAAVLWDAATGRTIHRWDLPPGFQDLLAFHPSGKLLLARVETLDGRIPAINPARPKKQPWVFRLRDLLSPKPEQPFKDIGDFGEHVFHSDLSPDGSLLVADGMAGPHFEGRAVNAYDGLTGTRLWSRPSDVKWENSYLRLDPTGRIVAIETSERTTTLLDARTEKHIATLPAGYLYIEFGPEAKLRVVTNSGPPWGILLYRLDEREPLIVLGVNVPCSGLKFDVDGRHLAWGNRDGTVTLADLEEVQRRLAEFKLEW
jgi:serine/threonine protein kinase/WD40 repeat protein